MEELKLRDFIPHLPDAGVVYRHLRAMEKDNLVSSVLEPGDGPARKVYSITEEGNTCLYEWIDRLEKARDNLNRFLKQAGEIKK
jgi:DNA-binding PadR family transcriptional regulator